MFFKSILKDNCIIKDIFIFYNYRYMKDKGKNIFNLIKKPYYNLLFLYYI